MPRGQGARSWHKSLGIGLDVTAVDSLLLCSSQEACGPWKGLTGGVSCLSLSGSEAWKGVLAVPIKAFKNKSPFAQAAP